MPKGRWMWFFFALFAFVLLVILVPLVVVEWQQEKQAHKDIIVELTLTQENRVIQLPLEDYIRGVVAAEMPVEFHLEALKAQALAARTYVMHRLKGNRIQVTDTIKDQAYLSDKQLKQIWGNRYSANMEKIRRAVAATQGKMITYQGKPISALFFSTSNGFTENSEEYFQQYSPYLRSVASHWDTASPKFKQTKRIRIQDMLRLLKRATGKEVKLDPLSITHKMRVKSRTTGNRVKQVVIGDQIFTGREVREALQLASSDFTWQVEGEELVITTKGYGHGVGMSQYGAHMLAKQGKKVEEIIQYYYRGVEIVKI